MNLGDPELELIDPTPDVHSLFLHFDKLFFWTSLASRAVVRWSKRMYTCAGICSYEGRSGFCDIALSEPLLKLRPRKDLVETLLHEMIHAYLFITRRDRDRDGHGPIFLSHMHRINQFAGLNINVYHDFHDEVKLYQTHWWRCNGPCQSRRPHFGIVRRTCNRAPGKSDYWWRDHLASCGGTFIKIKEPEKKDKKAPAPKPSTNPITKYINNNNENILNKNIQDIPSSKPVLKDSNYVPPKPNPKPKINGIATIVSTKRDNIVFNPKPPSIKPFIGTGQIIPGSRSRTQSASAAEAVRNIWANKQLPGVNIDTHHSPVISGINNNLANANKNKRISTDMISTPKKIMKIDDYYKDKASSILKDVYGQDFKVTQPKDSNKLVAVTVKKSVNCPVCNASIADDIINMHLDECLNKDIIDKLSKEMIPIASTVETTETKVLKVSETSAFSKYIKIPEVSKFKLENTDIKLEIPDSINLSFMDELIPDKLKKGKGIGKTTHKEINDAVYSMIKSEGTIKADLASIIKPIDVKVDYTTKDIITLKGEMADNKEKDQDIQGGKHCPCCNVKVFKPMADHLEECLKFFGNDKTIPQEGASTSMNNAIIIDDDDDIFDETMTMNPTGTKTPCPCCLNMIELDNMNDHLDECLQ
ncbi:sprT-like domain-containing protein Spartan [Manduca sexta]|uniref:sprT-like domain-containing protein Spartan n=1 Tax=Manduca sexta TaxID=7130 RepID=UPI00188ED04B|nr:sprT-like domain-containing protein Spartan [Manduca sexta]